MNAKIFRSWRLMLVLAALPLVAGSLQSPSPEVTAEETAAIEAPTVTETNALAVGQVVSTNAPLPEAIVKPAPLDVKLSPGAIEIVKLAQSGVGEDVMLAYITNAPSTFNLGPDQIV